MRIIAGACRGRPIEAPPGAGTRPTTDRMRESLMSRIGSLRQGFEDARVLDAFAGSGALGLEALSRGASRCLFCEKNRRALTTLRTNIARLGYGDQAMVRGGDVLAAGAVLGVGPYDLVFFDPPYAMSGDKVASLLRTLLTAGQLAPGAIVSWESRREDAEERAASLKTLGFEAISSKALAQSAVTLARYPFIDDGICR